MAHLERVVGAGLFATAQHWERLRTAHAWVVRAAQILANHAQADGAAVAGAYRALLTDLLAHQTNPALEPFVTHFYNVTMRYWRGLFWCYDLLDVPRTNNDLEQYFGVARYLERRATGRKRPPAGVGVRGSVRVVAAVATRLTPVAAAALQPPEVERWRLQRRALEARQEARRMQRRFRRDPAAYLVRLEAHLLQ